MHRWADAKAAEMVLSEPDRIVAGVIHDLDALQCTGIDRRQIDPPLQPTEKLQYTYFHCRFPLTLCQKSTAARAQRSGCSRLTPCPYPANSSTLPFGNVSARIFCCSEAIWLLSPLNNSTGALTAGSSGFTSIDSKHSWSAAAISARVLSISAMHHSCNCALACSRS